MVNGLVMLRVAHRDTGPTLRRPMLMSGAYGVAEMVDAADR